MITENYETFRRWFSDFKNKHDETGITIDKEWFDAVEEAHQGIREKIGGVRLVKKINVESSVAPANSDAAYEIFAEMDKCFKGYRVNYTSRDYYSNYMKTFNYCLSARDIDEEDLLLPTISVGSHSGMKTSKFLAGLAKDNVLPEKQKEYANLIAKLGQHWAKAKTTHEEYEVNLSTAPKAFMLLGHYSADEGSCFGSGGGHESDKKELALCDNSYVISIKKDGKYVARTWGFPNKNLNVFNTCNLYMKDIKEGNVIGALKMFFSDLLETKAETIHVSQNKLYFEADVYLNDESQYSFSKGKSIGEQVLRKTKVEYDGHNDLKNEEEVYDDGYYEYNY